VTANEFKLIRHVLKPFVDYGMLNRNTIQQIGELLNTPEKKKLQELLTRQEVNALLKITDQTIIAMEKEGRWLRVTGDFPA
jgi:hypothetical protein